MNNEATFAGKIKGTAWKWLIVGHRWLGIGTCLLFAMWFASGLVMMYVAFPSLTKAERIALSQRIDWSRITITPEQVLRGLSLGEYPRELRLVMMNGEPVYQVNASGWPPRVLSAVDGRLIEHTDSRSALSIARSSAPDAKPMSAKTLEADQWTVAQSFHSHRPLYRVALNDPSGTELYISSQTGEIVLDTTARERAWNWVGSVAHWL